MNWERFAEEAGVKGGQGHSGADVLYSAIVCGVCALGMLAVLIIALVRGAGQ